MKKISIAIDGPSGSGKSTIASIVARKLGYYHLNTGSLYRAYALFCCDNKIDANNEDLVFNAVKNERLEVEFAQGQRTILNGVVVDDDVRREEVGLIASKISAFAKIRDLVNIVIRGLCDKYNLVVDGRDIGTVVLPNADIKIYLDASAEKRAERRYKQLGGIMQYGEILENIIKRDIQDMTREVAPLKKAQDSFYLDTSCLGIDQVCDIILEKVGEKK